MNLQELLRYANEKDASDLHFAVGVPPTVRIHGKLTPVPGAPPLNREESEALVAALLTERQRQIFQQEHEVDFSYELDGVARFRVNIFQYRMGIGAAFRLIPSKIRTLEELGLPTSLQHLAKLEQGFVLVTGPTGSGKTTTLAALIDYANQTRHDHIITIEDPIEYVFQHKNCIINQREAGTHTNSFAAALRAALREDPDIILVGEMRDLETIALAITAAETGHLVFATLHTNSAAETMDRIVDVFPAHQQQQIRAQLAGSLAAVISQRLIPRADGEGRVPAFEIMYATSGIRSLVREGKSAQIPSLIQTGGNVGMITLDACLKNLLAEGKISQEDAFRHAFNKNLFAPNAGGSSKEPTPKYAAGSRPIPTSPTK